MPELRHPGGHLVIMFVFYIPSKSEFALIIVSQFASTNGVSYIESSLVEHRIPIIGTFSSSRFE